MTQTKTASEILANIEFAFFKGEGLAKASLLEGDERRAYKLSQVERLLKRRRDSTTLGLWLSDEFWTADEGREPMDESNPLLSQQGQQTLTDEEKERLRLIMEIAGLCHDLGQCYKFDLKEAFGVKNDYWVSNKQLVEWLSTTKYEQIAMRTAYIMKKHAIDVYACSFYYLPAQDELAELYSSKHKCTLGNPARTKIPPRDYVKTILDALQQIDRHWQRGIRLNLRPDVVILHDEIYGVVPHRFDKTVLQAAQELFDYMDEEVYGREVENVYPDVLDRFAEKVREVRDQYLADGWVMDDSLEFSYLMAHAERCANGFWREEDEAL